MKTEQVICYTCRFCKIDCRDGSLYCSLRKKGGQCIKYDKWESWENVLDKIRAEIEDLDIFYDNDYFSSNKDAMFKRSDVLQIIDKYKAESER